MYWPAYNDMFYPALSKFQPILDITSYLFSNMSMTTCNLKWAHLILVTLCARGMQLLNYRVGHLLRLEFEGTEPEGASWTVQPGLCVWVWSLERIVYHSADTLCCCYWLGPGQSSKLGEATNWPSPISSRLIIWFIDLSGCHPGSPGQRSTVWMSPRFTWPAFHCLDVTPVHPASVPLSGCHPGSSGRYT